MTTIPVVITEPEYIKARDIFDTLPDMNVAVSAPDEASVARTIRKNNARAAILGVETYVDELYEALPRGGMIARFGVGHDGIDKVKATSAGLLVTNTPGVLEDAVAEHALALMLGLYKHLASFVRSMDARTWRPEQSRELRGKRLAIIGCGAIGRRVARIAAFGFGMQVRGLDTRALNVGELQRDWGISAMLDTLQDAMENADIVSLHVPANEHTHHLINRDILANALPETILINTSRGRVVDECSLYDALASGTLAGAGLDVFETEPYEARDPQRDLRQLPNVLLTPHVSSGTVEACARVATAALRNIRLALAGDMTDLILLNPDVAS